MTPGLDAALRRSRESTSKVRTGCKTCKSRRVKCDEAKPVCRRCTVGGRTCEYNVASAAPTRRSMVTVYLAPSQGQPTIFVHDRCLDFFHHNLAAQLDGQFDTKFWSHLVLQLSHPEPSIRHAVSAISIIYQDVESSLQSPAGYVEANPEAQRECNKAMNSLAARIQAYPESSLVPLVCSLLFTCIEFLRGDGEHSVLHVEKGFNMLAAIRGHGKGDPELVSRLSSNDVENIEDHIVPMFSRLNVLCSLANRPTPSIYALAGQEHSPQEDLTESRRRLFEISDACIRFIRSGTDKASMLQIDLDDLVEQVKLQTRLDVWRNQFGSLLQDMQATGAQINHKAVNLLLVHYKVIHIWTRVCTTAEQVATDSCLADFQELVHYAEQVVGQDERSVGPQPLSFDFHVLGPLYYTALKCRHPATRRRALDLMQKAPLREGLWNTRYAYVTAKRVIELEERHLNGQEVPDEFSRIHGLHMPDDESRIFKPGQIPFDFRKVNHNIVPSPTCPGVLEAQFMTKPWGLSGEWQTFTEYLKL